MPPTNLPEAAVSASLAEPDPAVGDNQASPEVPEPEARAAELVSLANAHEQAERLSEAEDALHQALAVAPGHAGALHLLGILSFKQGWVEKATLLMEQSIGASPDTALYHRNICEVYRTLGRYDDALAAGRRAAALVPADPHCHHNLGVLHYDRLELDQAIACAERALSLDPEFAGAHLGIAEAALLRGDFRRGWEEYEWRFRVRNAPQSMAPTNRPQWDGIPLLRDRLLLIADQGYGDVIQFARYIPWAADRCRELAIVCGPEIRAVIAQQPGVGMIFNQWQDAPEFAAFCPLSGLPRLAGTTLRTIPGPIPYIRADLEKTAIWADRLSGLMPPRYRRVGIVWAARPAPVNDRNRSKSSTLATFAALGELSGLTLVSLQKGPAQAQIGAYWGRAPLVNLGPELRDFSDTMAVLDSLDLVVTVDTAVAHLAGAMGKPVWLMLPFAPDWRWQLDRADNPWYPTARLFRQAVPHQWDPVISEITSRLEAELTARRDRTVGRPVISLPGPQQGGRPQHPEKSPNFS